VWTPWRKRTFCPEAEGEVAEVEVALGA